MRASKIGGIIKVPIDVPLRPNAASKRTVMLRNSKTVACSRTVGCGKRAAIFQRRKEEREDGQETQPVLFLLWRVCLFHFEC